MFQAIQPAQAFALLLQDHLALAVHPRLDRVGLARHRVMHGEDHAVRQRRHFMEIDVGLLVERQHHLASVRMARQHGGDAERGGFAHDGDRKMFFFVPFNGMRCNLRIGKITRHVTDGDMVFIQGKKLGHGMEHLGAFWEFRAVKTKQGRMTTPVFV